MCTPTPKLCVRTRDRKKTCGSFFGLVLWPTYFPWKIVLLSPRGKDDEGGLALTRSLRINGGLFRRALTNG